VAAQAGDVVISYARSDGRELAGQLQAWVAGHGFGAWRDLTDMVGGEEWWRQLRERIEGARALLVVVTEGALASAVVRRELGVARRAGVPVLPVCPDQRVLTSAPRWMKDLDIFVTGGFAPDQAGQAWRRLLAQLLDPPPRRPAVAMVPPLPSSHVSRRELLAQVKRRLLDERGDGTDTTVVLIGGGGFGKTTLAQEAGLDEEIVSGYPAGVAWVTVGAEPGRLAAVLSELVSQLLGGPAFFLTADQALRRLAEILADRRCLVVLDDVWDPHVIDELRRGLAALLVTTREPEVAARDPAGPITVDRLAPDEARVLLLRDAGFSPETVDPAAPVGAVLAALDGWPLVISLAGAAIRRRMTALGASQAEAVAWFLAGFMSKGPAIADSRRSTDRNESLRASVALSLDLFDGTQQRRILELAVLPAGGAIPVEGVYRLWASTANMSAADCDDLLAEVSGHFLRVIREHPGGPATVIIHDVMRAHLATLLGQVQARRVHQRLLDALGPAGAPWPERVSDRYSAETLSYHLVGSGAAGELYTLLTGSPAWLDRSEAFTGSPAAFVADVARLIEASPAALDPGELATLHAASTVAYCRAWQLVDAALAVLVRLGEGGRALALARLRATPGERCAALRAILDSAPPGWPYADSALEELERNAPLIGSQRDASAALEDLVARLISGNELARAEQMARRAPLEWASDQLLTRVVVAHAERGDLDEARRVFAGIVADRSEAALAVAVAEVMSGSAPDATLTGAFAALPDAQAVEAARAAGYQLGQAGLAARLTVILRPLTGKPGGLAMTGAARGLAQAGARDDAARLLDSAGELLGTIDFFLDAGTVTKEVAVAWADLGANDKVRALVASSKSPELNAQFVGRDVAAAGHLELALELAYTIRDRAGRFTVLLAVVTGYAAASDARRARKIAETMLARRPDPRAAANVISAVARADPAWALANVQRIADHAERARARLAAAVAISADSPAAARAALAQAIDELGDMGPRAELDGALGPLAAVLAGSGNPGAAAALTALASNHADAYTPVPRVVALRRAALAAALAGDLESAKALASQAPTEFDRDSITRDLLPVRARAGDLASVLADLAQVDELYREWPLLQVLNEIVPVKGANEALRTWTRLRSPQYPRSEGYVRCHLAAALARAGDLDAAMTFAAPVVKSITPDESGATAWYDPAIDFPVAKLAELAYRANHREDALRLARLADRRDRLEDEWQAELLAGTGQIAELGRRLAGSKDLVLVASLWCAAGVALDRAGLEHDADEAFARAEQPALRSAGGEDVLGIGRMEKGKSAPLRTLAAAQARRGRWLTAYRLLGVRPAGVFVQEVTDWLMASPDLIDAQRLRAVTGMLAVLAWTGPTWTQIRDLAGPAPLTQARLR
jgi:hypothetical protein